ncbi:MAG: FxsA family protein [Rhodospirillales bacterium]|nr:FxsA family protein [Rhodospirillales bacterium]
MGLVLLLLFVGIPILEIALLIEAGDRFGLWPTVGTIVFTAVVGAALVRRQGFSTLMRAQQSLNSGQVPMKEVFDGLCILVAGAMLLTPGFVTDSFGFLLLIPAFRAVLRQVGGRYMVTAGRVDMWDQQPKPGPTDGGRGKDRTIIEGEYETIDEGDNNGQEPKRPSDR